MTGAMDGRLIVVMMRALAGIRDFASHKSGREGLESEGYEEYRVCAPWFVYSSRMGFGGGGSGALVGLSGVVACIRLS